MADCNGKITVVGGGPVGTLSAILLGRRGFKVDLYEARSDIREEKSSAGKSINLSLSLRGISALKYAGIDREITAIGTPIHSRYIHVLDGSHYTIPHGKKGQFVLSTDRLELNRRLLTLAEKSENVNLHFQHKLVRCDTKIPSATFQKADGEFSKRSADVLFGCDGAYSAVRSNLLKGRMDYSQMYIEHGYKELCIPPTATGDYALPPNNFHIWPRHEFMLIALPNMDKSFTCTLIMPFRNYEKFVTGDDVINFFDEYFSDAIPLIGEELLRESFFTQPPLALVTVKCDPYHYGKTAVLLGDAAHAVVPFFGQGLNAGLEDALIFDELMEQFGNDFSRVLPAFSETRVKSGHTIADLSLSNYMEMRSHVAKSWFLFRRKVDGMLYYLFPTKFIPRHIMVTYTRIPYYDIVKRSERRDKIIDACLVLIGGIVIALGAWGVFKLTPNLDALKDFTLELMDKMKARF